MEGGPGRANYRRFLSAHTISWLGDAFSFVAFPLLVLEETGSLFDMGVVTAAGASGPILSGALLGPLVDRVHPRLLLVVCDLAQALLYGFLLAYVANWGVSVQVVAPVVGVASVFSGVSGICATTSVPRLVPKEELTRSNGHLMAAYSVTRAVGPAAAGFVIAAFGTLEALAIDLLTFCVSAICFGFTRFRDAEQSYDSVVLTKARWSGFAVLWTNPSLRLALTLMIPSVYLMVGSKDILVFLLKEEAGASDQMVGIFFALVSVGGIVGGLVAPRLRSASNFWLVFCASVALQGLCVLIFGLHAAPSTAVPIGIGFGLGAAVSRTFSASLRQEVVPQAMLGRASAAYMAVGGVAGPVAALTVPLAAQSVGSTLSIVAIGSAVVLISFGVLAASVKRDSGVAVDT